MRQQSICIGSQSLLLSEGSFANGQGLRIPSENYEVIRDILINKFRKPSTMKSYLRNELECIKRSVRDIKSTFKKIERVLRQLEA